MSFNLLQLIPADPEYVPDATAQQAAQRIFASLVSGEGEETEVSEVPEVTVEVSDTIQFFDAGTSWERTLCPNCRSHLSVEWWQQAMDSAYSTGFQNLDSKLPCCGSVRSLNELTYEMPQGFARFALIARDPNVNSISESNLRQLETILGCSLRLIRSYY